MSCSEISGTTDNVIQLIGTIDDEFLLAGATISVVPFTGFLGIVMSYIGTINALIPLLGSLCAADFTSGHLILYSSYGYIKASDGNLLVWK